jgi:hypothetical protein
LTQRREHRIERTEVEQPAEVARLGDQADRVGVRGLRHDGGLEGVDGERGPAEGPSEIGSRQVLAGEGLQVGVDLGTRRGGVLLQGVHGLDLPREEGLHDAGVGRQVRRADREQGGREPAPGPQGALVDE